MDLDSFYPAKDRFQLAMRLNNLLAAPGFEAWLEGDPLNINRLFFTDSGRPKASIFTISHLSDAERMFFVSMLLNEILAWMRTQTGTSSLRAILYMDEIFGYFPPVKNPPSKAPLLTMLKQARAFGLGVVLSTQNPVDLDYKGLSNTGSWFIGRLQTERDKERVLAGLEGAAAGTGFDRSRMEEILAGLGKRVFLLNNVHENQPVTFETRWVLSYLRGPMTREQIKILMADKKSQQKPVSASVQSAAAALPATPADASAGVQVPSAVSEPPVVAPEINVMYFAASGAGHGLMYYPAVAGWLDVHYSSVRYKVDTTENLAVSAMLEDGPVPLDWDQAEEITLAPDALQTLPLPGASFADLPSKAKKVKSYSKWNKDLLRWVRQNRSLILYRSKQFKLTSHPAESKSEFLSRLNQAAREKRDLEIEKLRRKYSSKFNTLQRRLMRAEQALQREQEQVKSKKMETMVSFGTAILGAFLGRKTVSTRSATRFGTAVKSAGRMRKESMDVARAQQTAEAVKQEMAELDGQLQSDIDSLEASYDPASEQLEEVLVKPKSTDITLEAFGLAWMPYRKGSDGRLSPDWQ